MSKRTKIVLAALAGILIVSLAVAVATFAAPSQPDLVCDGEHCEYNLEKCPPEYPYYYCTLWCLHPVSQQWFCRGMGGCVSSCP